VYHYAQKFNSLCQYGGHHVDTDAKKMERFRDGLDGKLYERLNLLEPANFHELMNNAISQEDAMKKAHKNKKRSSGFAPGSRTHKKFHFCEEECSKPIPAIFNLTLDDEATPGQTFRELPVPQCSAAGSKA
jgi:predicted GIY-YIG superfamily endonuclease